jgi:hypothetical protein
MLNVLELPEVDVGARPASGPPSLDLHTLQLIRENEELRLRVAALEHALMPGDDELDALAREADARRSRRDQPAFNDI